MQTFYYIHTDYLGSWLAITDNSGSLKQRYSYDAWGRPRDPVTWLLKTIGTTNPLVDLAAMQPRFDRGYTGHEMMANFALINMNGRFYDPLLGMFISPDNFVQNPSSSQNFNRYTYCLGNPLMYTDPNGLWSLGLGLVFGYDNHGWHIGFGAACDVGFNDFALADSGL